MERTRKKRERSCWSFPKRSGRRLRRRERCWRQRTSLSTTMGCAHCHGRRRGGLHIAPVRGHAGRLRDARTDNRRSAARGHAPETCRAAGCLGMIGLPWVWLCAISVIFRWCADRPCVHTPSAIFRQTAFSVLGKAPDAHIARVRQDSAAVAGQKPPVAIVCCCCFRFSSLPSLPAELKRSDGRMDTVRSYRPLPIRRI